MSLEVTQPLTDEYQESSPGGIALRAHKADNLTAICESIV
jgi:hypothetical protein